MTYRDDLEAALQRNRALEIEHNEALQESEQKLADKSLELATLQAKTKRRNGMRWNKLRKLELNSKKFQRGVGFVSIVLGILGLGLLYTTSLNWSPYIQAMTVAMEDAGRAKMVGGMTVFNLILLIWLGAQSLALVAIGVGQLKNWVWASGLAIPWSILGLMHILISVLGTEFIEGQALDWGDWVATVILSAYPVFLLVFRKRLK